MFRLETLDGPCADHKDCTATTFVAKPTGIFPPGTPDKVLGVRHYHQWLDAPGKHEDLGRDPGLHVFGGYHVGALRDFDPETGTADFNADEEWYTASEHPIDGECGADGCPCPHPGPEHRLNDTYPIADDHRQAKDKTGNHPKLVRPGAKRPKR